MNALDGGWIIATGYKHNRNFADLPQPSGSLYPIAPSIKANVNQSHVGLVSHGERTSVSVV